MPTFKVASTKALCDVESGVSELVPLQGYVCLPGDPVLVVNPSAVLGLGGGLRLLNQPSFTSSKGRGEPAVLVAEYCAAVQCFQHSMHAGVPRYTLASPASRRYAPQAADPIIAIITKKVSQHYYCCYLGGSSLAYLDALAFDGATKVGHPRLNEGDVVYCYVKKRTNINYVDGAVSSDKLELTISSGNSSVRNSLGDVEVSCVASEVGLQPKDWTSGEAVFGPLYGGKIISVPLPYARGLLTSPSCCSRREAGKRARDEEPRNDTPASHLLHSLGRRVPYEVAVGMNGYVWIKGQSKDVDPAAVVRHTVAVCSCVEEAQCDTSCDEIEARIETLLSSSDVMAMQ